MIPFVDITRQYKNHSAAFQRALEDVCSSAAFILGPEVARFEKRFADYIGVKEAVGVASGTDALRLACMACGVERGDELLVPANTFIATAAAVYDIGAIPVPVDADPETFLMDMKDAEKKVNNTTKAIIPVHLYGQSMNMDLLSAFALKHNLLVIEDACQAHGAIWNGRRVGGFGAVGCFSFYPSKNLGAFGDGGLATTNDSGLAEKLRMMRNYGSIRKNVHEIPGTNSRLDSIQAAILNVKLDFLDEWNEKRFKAACRYADALCDIEELKLPAFNRKDISRHVFHLFVVQCERRENLLGFLRDKDIQCGIHYATPIHLHPSLKSLGFREGACPVSEMFSKKIVSLPIFPEISEEQTLTVINAVREFFGKNRL